MKASSTLKNRIRVDAQAGFTLLELLVVIAILAVLAGILLPVLSRAKAKAQAVACLSNYKQLQLAWQVYAVDHADRMPPNGRSSTWPYPRNDVPFWWAQGTMDYIEDHEENINTDLLVRPEFAQMGSYTVSPALYHCPSDRSEISIEGRARARVRSVSMNAYLGAILVCDDDGQPSGPQRLNDIPHPARTFVFLDEHPDSIGFIQFWVDPEPGPGARFIGSYPGSYHSAGASVSFADGHVERHRWRNQQTLRPIRRIKVPGEEASENNPDLEWLRERTVFPSD